MGQKKKSNKSSSKFVFWVVGLAAAGILALLLFGNFSKEKDETKEAEIDYSNQPFLGDESAPVSIIEFGDYKCPACKSFAADTMPLIVDELVDTGKAKLYFMNDSFINIDSERSAQFAEAVFQELGNETFWEFHELLYQKQPEDPNAEKQDIYTEDFLTETLKEIVSDAEADKVVESFSSEKSKAAWKQDMDYAEKLGVTGTPTIFVNGKKFEGQTMDDLAEMVEQAAEEK